MLSLSLVVSDCNGFNSSSVRVFDLGFPGSKVNQVQREYLGILFMIFGLHDMNKLSHEVPAVTLILNAIHFSIPFFLLNIGDLV